MKAYIPYGGYWSTPFARWQGDLSHLHSIEFAAHVTRHALGKRGIGPEAFDFGAYGFTIPQKGCFYGMPWFGGLIGAEKLTGPTINQACATGTRLMATAAAEIGLGNAGTTLVVSGDRCSNAPHVYYPNPAGPGGAGDSEAWLLDAFNKDPWARCAMVDTAENVARRAGGISTEEQHEVVLRRCAQYGDATAHGHAFMKRYMDLPFEVPDARFRKTVTTMEGDMGVTLSTAEGLARLKPVREGGSVTFGGQTHPADGVAGMIITDTPEKAAELASDKAVRIEIIAFGQAREDKGFMPAAPIEASGRALSHAGLDISDMAAIKAHNPFAVNDIAFSRAFGIRWEDMNNYGSSLVWGHPQGPTALRSVIELIEELAIRGGGHGLFQGCAAGDSAMAAIIKVS